MSVSRLARVFVLLLTCVLAPIAAWGQKAACTTNGVVTTTSGPICGLAPISGGPAVSSYLGIPYAQAQRWQQPQPPQNWTSTFSATQIGNTCPQPTLEQLVSSAPSCPTPPNAGAPTQSEDCLYLNVWVPQGASPANHLPVMVFIHGGAFVFGSGEQPVFDGSNLAAAGNVISGGLGVPMIVGTNQNEGTLFAAIAALKLVVSPADYQNFLKNLVGPQNVSSVLSNSKYQCDSGLGCTTQIAAVITDYVFACANRHLAEAAPGSTYTYDFSESPTCNPTPGLALCEQMVCHGAEIPYVFDNPQDIKKCFFTPGQSTLSRAIQSYWTSFAKSQSPSGPAPWPAFQNTKNYMILGLPPSGGSLQTATDPWSASANCALWESIGYQQPAFWDRFLASLRSRVRVK